MRGEANNQVFAAQELLRTGHTSIVRCELFRDVDSDLIWMTDMYGQDHATSGTGASDCLHAIRWAVDHSNSPHPAEKSW